MRIALLSGLFLTALTMHLKAAADTADYSASISSQARPAITIIIDDIGHRGRDGARAVELPGPVAFAVLPHTPFGRDLAERAHASGKEVLLHLPLEAIEKNELLGNGALKLDDSKETFAKILQDNLDAVPHVTGINNHMGSLLTRHPGHMRWLMHAMREDGKLFFIDSVTTPHSVALNLAREYSLPAARRDIFLDSKRDIAFIERQFERLRTRAVEKGHAIAIGHPFPETLEVLESQLPLLGDAGIQLISVRDMIRRQNGLEKGTNPPVPGSAIEAGPGLVLTGRGVPLQQELK